MDRINEREKYFIFCMKAEVLCLPIKLSIELSFWAKSRPDSTRNLEYFAIHLYGKWGMLKKFA